MYNDVIVIIYYNFGIITIYYSRIRTQIWCYIAYSKRRVVNDSALGNDKALYSLSHMYCHSITLSLCLSLYLIYYLTTYI